MKHDLSENLFGLMFDNPNPHFAKILDWLEHHQLIYGATMLSLFIVVIVIAGFATW